MRGAKVETQGLFSYISPEQRVPQDLGASAQAAFYPGRESDSGSGRCARRLEARQAAAKGFGVMSLDSLGVSTLVPRVFPTHTT